MKHTITLSFESTKELLEFTSQHLNGTDTKGIHTTVTTPLVITATSDLGEGTRTTIGSSTAADEAVSEPVKETKSRAKKVKAEEAPKSADADEATSPLGTDAAGTAEAATSNGDETMTDPLKTLGEAGEEAELDYKKDVRPTIMTMLKKPDGSKLLFKIYDEFGVTAATELTTKQLPAFLEAVQKELGE